MPRRGTGVKLRIVDPTEISAPGLLLRRWQPSDAPEVLRALTDAAVKQWNPSPGAIDLAAARNWIDRRADWADDSHVSFAVAEPGAGALLGSVSLHRISREQGDAAIGYWTLAHARGRGVASLAVAALTGWAFDTLGLHRIELCHAVPNVASCRVADKAGYRHEGTLRESYRYGDGFRYDEHIHGRLATDG